MIHLMKLSDLEAISNNFLHELERANVGYKTSLPFIIHTTSNKPLIHEDEVFQVMVVGGTVFKSALIKKTAEGLKIIKEEKSKIEMMSTKGVFLSFIEKNLDKNIAVLGLNFAYPLQPVFEGNKLDGVLLFSRKGHKLVGLQNETIGKEIEDYIFGKYVKRIRVSVANDAICLLLSGLAKFSGEGLAAGIVGTGLNFSFFIDRQHIVNTESGSFDKLPRPEKTQYRLSGTKNENVFERQVAGAYLYKNFNLHIKAEKIDYPPIANSSQLSELAAQNMGRVSDLAREILTRSANLVACQIAGIGRFKNQDMTFVMEGSLFWKGYKYKQTVNDIFKLLVPQHKVEFEQIENSDILGASKLVS